MSKDKEYIVCSAINYKGQIVTGISCSQILQTIAFFEPKPDAKEIANNQGFITSTGRFVSREEAYVIANDNNQIKYNIMEFKGNGVPFLMSINLYEY